MGNKSESRIIQKLKKETSIFLSQTWVMDLISLLTRHLFWRRFNSWYIQSNDFNGQEVVQKLIYPGLLTLTFLAALVTVYLLCRCVFALVHPRKGYWNYPGSDTGQHYLLSLTIQSPIFSAIIAYLVLCLHNPSSSSFYLTLHNGLTYDSLKCEIWIKPEIIFTHLMRTSKY